MRFDKVSITGFRGIKSLQVNDLSRINLFVGKNNSSKTSVLEAIYILCGAYNPSLLINVDNFRGILLDESNDLRYIFNDLNYTNDLLIEGSATLNKYVRSVKVKPNRRKVNDSVQVITNVIGSQQIAYADNDEINELITTFTIKEEHKPKKEYTCSIHHNMGPNFQTELTKGFRPDIRTNFLGVNTGSVLDLNKVLNELIITKKHHILVDILNKIDSSAGPKMTYLDIEGMEQLIPINLCGDGIKKLFNLILAMYDSREGMIFIDEIENGLHFSAYDNLWEAIFYFSNLYNIQVFATTHSIETLQHLNSFLNKPENVASQSEITNYTIRRLANGEHKLYAYKFAEIDNAINDDIEIR